MTCGLTKAVLDFKSVAESFQAALYALRDEQANKFVTLNGEIEV